MKNGDARQKYYIDNGIKSAYVNTLKGYNSKEECERAVSCYCKPTNNNIDRCRDEYKKTERI